MNTIPRSASAFFVMVLALASFPSCDGGGGGGSGAGEEFFVIGASIDDDRVLPQDSIYVNDPIRILMSTDVDPDSVTSETVELVNVDPKGDPPIFSVIVDGPWIAFLPRFPASPRSPGIGGFRPGEAYRVSMPGFSATSTVTSDRGRVQRDAFETHFRVRDFGVLVRDLGPGAPHVEAVLIDLDGDGEATGDGLRGTSESEEFFTFTRVPLVENVPIGLLRQPIEVAIRFSEPVFEAELLDRVRVETEAGEPVAGVFAYAPSFDPESGRFRARLSFRPATPLSPMTLHRIVIEEGVTDFETPPFHLMALEVSFRTGEEDDSIDDAVVEEFSDTLRRGAATTALWNVSGSGALVATAGLGGDGSRGDFRAMRDTVFDTTENGGVFDFVSFYVPPAREVRFVGPNPAVVRVQGDARIEGRVVSEGEPGGSAIISGGTLGGAPGAAGARGGNGNPNWSDAESPCGEPGESPPGAFSVGFCPACGTPRAGGGCGGQRSFTFPSGGGGGGHATEGEGAGGLPYGDETMTVPLGGSGGGAGGNTASVEFTDDTPGGAGGGGGGVIEFEVLGRFDLSGVASVSGGRGGSGSRFGGGGGGGGGSGGSMLVRATSVEIAPGAALLSLGGAGGASRLGDGEDGGAGARGRIRIETGAPPVGLELGGVDPPASVGDLERAGAGRSFAESRYYDTLKPSPRYFFDGSDPRTGALRTRSEDVELPNGIPRGASARIEFFGADEDPAAPEAGTPDPSTEVGPVTDVSLLDGKRFVRFAIEFVVDFQDLDAPPLSIDRLAIRFRE